MNTNKLKNLESPSTSCQKYLAQYRVEVQRYRVEVQVEVQS